MVDILSLNTEEISALVAELQQPTYRAKQIQQWLSRDVASFDDMSDLPSALRDRLKERCILVQAKIVQKAVSAIDGTVKYLFEFADGEKIESVFMRNNYGNTLCISTQAGCRMGCSFCASTLKGLSRNLLPSEMLAQISAAQRDMGERVSNIVLMGIGEPLDNYDNTLAFLRSVNSEARMNIGMRHISLSTCGLVEKMKLLAEEKLSITLSVSLHAPNDEIRRAIMPIARKYSYDELLDACRYYIAKTNRRISFEYALIDGVNDTEECAKELVKRLKGMLCHVNLIPINEVSEKSYKKSKNNVIKPFTNILNEGKINVTLRRHLGGDINASCGQLRAQHIDK